MEEEAEVEESDPIPEGYESWSLFLVSNPTWLHESGAKRIAELHAHFKALGQALGSRHVAIWFWQGGGRRVGAARSTALCKRFGLSLRSGPYLVVTTRHPESVRVTKRDDGSTEPPEKVIAIDLGSLGFADMKRVLGILADAIVHERLDRQKIDSQIYWEKWRGALGSAFAAIQAVTERVSIELNAGIFKISYRTPTGR